MTDTPPATAIRARPLWNREVGAGLFLLLLAGIGIYGSLSLAFGQLSGVGPGLMPRVTAVLVGGFGILLILQGLTLGAEPMEPWSLRGLVLVIGAIAVFGFIVRPLGLAVAGPVTLILASLADPSTRAREIIPFAIVLSAACVLLFKFMLRLPIPLCPPLLGY